MQRRILSLCIAVALALAINPARAADEGNESDIGPIEDLMREHGVLRRVLLIYEEGLRRIAAHQDYAGNPFLTGAQLIRRFIEDYHEKNEEKFIFPKLQKAGGEAGRDVAILLEQHQAGRKLTDEIIRVAAINAKDNRLVDPATQFIRMYRPHAAREDTIVFPAWKSTMNKHQFEEISDLFEDIEHKTFGADGFEEAEHSISQVESSLGLSDIAQFTPAPPPKP